jgi:hypothetical protein
MLAGNLGQRVAQCVQEVLVGGDDRAVELEFDDRLGAVDGRRLRERAGCFCLALSIKHLIAFRKNKPRRGAGRGMRGAIGTGNSNFRW